MEVDAHSLANFTGKNINIDLTNNTTETTGNRGIVGIGSQGDATVTGATGVYFTGADANVKINLTGNNNAQSIYSVMLTQNAILDVSSNVDKFILHTNYAGTNANAKVMGVELNTGGTNTVANFHNKTTEINITNLNNTNDDNLSAVHINSIGGKVVFDGDNATLTTTGGSNSGTTIYVAGAKAEPSQVFVNAKDTIIKATATTSTDVNNSTAACAWKENAGIYINSDENGAAQGNTVNVEGGMWSLTGGTIKANLTNANSSLTGWTSIASDKSGNFDLGLASGAKWNLNRNSSLSNLSNNNATIDMHYTGSNKYETITTGDYAGVGGTIIMDTDLNSEADGDKLIITNGTSAGSGYIQVYDKSLVDGNLEGPKKLLVVEDTNGTTSWQGKSLDTGGLWTINPTVEKIGNDWYLVLPKKTDPIQPVVSNPTANTFLGLTDAAYTNWRAALTDDTLRKRLGDLRYNEAEGGLWARVKAGKLSSSNYDGSYQTYQVGIDKRKDDTNYGVAVDYSRGKGNYELGNGDTSMTNLSLYATSYHPSGVYNDFVVKAGKYRGDIAINTNNDAADYSAWAYSASYELGKTYTKSNGWFVEPEAQLVYGYMQGSDYTSKLGVEASRDAIHSFLGRVGFVAGRKLNEASDYYVKANMWREFAGTGAINLTAANNYGDREFMPADGHHKDTWFELGLGGNVKLAKKTHVYGDILKTFGADIQKKWQINAGVRWEF